MGTAPSRLTVSVNESVESPIVSVQKMKMLFMAHTIVWTRKVKGKTVTRNLTDSQAELCREYIQNMRKLEIIIKKMKELTVKHIGERRQPLKS